MAGVNFRIGRVRSRSALADVAAGLSANTWGSLTTIGITSAMITRGDGDNIFSYCHRGQWDSTAQRIYFYGSTHGTQRLKRMIRYIAATNTWEVDSDGQPETDGNDSHGYYHFAIRPSDGRQFVREYNTSTVWQRAPGGSWSAITAFDGVTSYNWNVSNTIDWYPEANSGAGGLVFTGSRSIYATNSTYSSWSTWVSDNGANAITSERDNASAYSLYDNRLFIGGGNTSPTTMKRVDPDGSVVARASCPVNIGTSGVDGGGLLISGATGKLLAVGTGGAVHEFDDSGNTWSSSISTLPFSAVDAQFFGVTIPEYGVIAFMYLSSGNTPSTTMWLFKH